MERDEQVDDGFGFRKGRTEAALVVLPFVALGVANLALLLLWGLNVLWGFLLLPPILFVSVVGWIAIRGGFAENRTGEGDYDGGV